MTPTEEHDWFVRSGKGMATVARLGAKIHLPDVLTMPSNRPILMAGNHRSLLDLAVTMAIFSKFGISSRIMVREDLMDSGLGGKYLRSIGCIATSKDRKEESEAEAIEALMAGHLVSMMPEGRLVKPEEWVDGVGPGRHGVSRIATAANAVIVPVGFSNTERVWPRARPPRMQFPRPDVHLRVGPSFELESTDHQVNADRVMAAISGLIAE